MIFLGTVGSSAMSPVGVAAGAVLAPEAAVVTGLAVGWSSLQVLG